MTPDVQRWFDGADWTEHTRPLPEFALKQARTRTVAPDPTRDAGSAAQAGRTATPATTRDAGSAAQAGAASWAGASGAVWLPAEPSDEVVPEPEPESMTAGWWGPGGAGMPGGRSRFGTL